MLNRSLITCIVFSSQLTFALPAEDIVGGWCSWHADFVEAYKFEENDQGEISVETYTVGRGAQSNQRETLFNLTKKAKGEMHGRSSGYVSFGVNGTRLVLDGEDTGVFEISTGFRSFSNRRTLTLYFPNDFKIKLTECRISAGTTQED